MSDSKPAWCWRRQLAAAGISLLFVLPLVFMVSGSLRRPGLPPPRTPELVPRDASLEAYGDAFDLVDLARYTLNSVVVALIVVPLTVLFASWAGFAMTRLPAAWARGGTYPGGCRTTARTKRTIQ